MSNYEYTLYCKEAPKVYTQGCGSSSQNRMELKGLNEIRSFLETKVRMVSAWDEQL